MTEWQITPGANGSGETAARYTRQDGEGVGCWRQRWLLDVKYIEA